MRYSEPFRRVRVIDERGRTMREFTDPKAARLFAREHRGEVKESRTLYVYAYPRRNVRGQRINTGCTTKEEAKTWLDIRRRGRKPSRSADRPFDEVVGEWLDREVTPRKAPKTTRDYRSQAKYWLEYFGNRPLSTITRGNVEDFLARRQDGTLGGRTKEPQRHSPRLLNLNIVLLNAFFKWCEDEDRGYIERNPAARVTRWDEAKTQVRILSEEEVAALLRACREKYAVTVEREKRRAYTTTQEFIPPPELYPIVLTAISTLLRIGNVLDLRWGEVDFKAKVIRIAAGKLKGREEVVIPMNKTLRDVLGSLPRGGPADRVFASARSIRRSFASACRRAGLDGVTFHSLRKTAADYLRRKGVTLEAAQKLGAWADPEVMLNHYRRPGLEELREAAGRLEDLVGA